MSRIVAALYILLYLVVTALEICVVVSIEHADP